MTTTVLDISKKIIRKAAEVGLDNAGSFFLPRSWKYFKIILTPIIKELEKKYPKMLLVDAKEPNIDNENAQASLEQDTHLQEQLNNGFDRLSIGQDKISADIQAIDSKLDKLDVSVMDLGEKAEKGFSDVLEAVNRRTGAQNPGRLKIVDTRITNIRDERKCYVDFYVSNDGGSQVIVVKVNFKVVKTARAELIKALMLPSGEYDLDISALENPGDTITCQVSQSIDPGKSDLFRIILSASKLKSGVFAAWKLLPVLVTNYGEIAADQLEVWLPFKDEDVTYSKLEQIAKHANIE
jgi:archaellum component FlaC